MTTKDPHTFTPEQSEQLRAHVLDQLKVHTDACIGLAKAFFEVFYGTVKGTNASLVMTWGFDDFDHFVEKELLWHGGTARSYIRVYDELCVRRQFNEGALPPSITALRELSKISRKVIDARELDRWIKRSRELTACEFKAEVEAFLYGKHGKRRTIGFAMQWTAAGRCLKRIREARETLGLGTNGEALERILNEWALGKRTTSELRALRRAG
jgi:hypothetical protein